MTDLVSRAIILEWIQKLRSGKIKLIKANLKTEEGCCGLGVLADILVARGVGKWKVSRGRYIYSLGNDSSGKFLPPLIEREIDSYFHLSGFSDATKTVMLLNDDRGSNFNMIADMLERRLHKEEEDK